MKYISWIFILILFQGCQLISDDFVSKKTLRKDIYDIVNQTILDQRRDVDNVVIDEADSIILTDFLYEPCPKGGFSLNESDSIVFLIFNTFGSANAEFEKYFAPSDLDYIKNQISISDNSCWKAQKLTSNNVADSLFSTNDSIHPNIDIWRAYKDQPLGYLTVSNPIFNKRHDKAVITTDFYVSDNYFLSLIEFERFDKNKWIIKSKYTLIYKLGEDYFPDSDEIGTFLVYRGGFESYPQD
jgi:hypothetical protein